MTCARPVLLFENDPAVLGSLQFALALEGFEPQDGTLRGADPASAMCLVVDQRYAGSGLIFLQELRQSGAKAPAVLLATNPTRRLRFDAAAAGAVLIEKPLLGDELTEALQEFGRTQPGSGAMARPKQETV